MSDIRSPREKMWAKVKGMSNVDLQVVWEALREYDPSEMYDADIPMDEWAETIRSEMTDRGITA